MDNFFLSIQLRSFKFFKENMSFLKKNGDGQIIQIVKLLQFKCVKVSVYLLIWKMKFE